ncbi:MAG: hypothetical protein K2N15_15990 [Lachnospiraceae bacterium]|nr:hypothetical protein [Lachnospiraceae bacterium]
MGLDGECYFVAFYSTGVGIGGMEQWRLDNGQCWWDRCSAALRMGAGADGMCGGAAGCFWFQGYGEKSVISLTEWKNIRGVPPRMAGLGATRQDAVWLRPVRLEKNISIPLVKSDLKTRPETKSKPLPLRACRPPLPPYPKHRRTPVPPTLPII